MRLRTTRVHRARVTSALCVETSTRKVRDLQSDGAVPLLRAAKRGGRCRSTTSCRASLLCRVHTSQSSARDECFADDIPITESMRSWSTEQAPVDADPHRHDPRRPEPDPRAARAGRPRARHVEDRRRRHHRGGTRPLRCGYGCSHVNTFITIEASVGRSASGPRRLYTAVEQRAFVTRSGSRATARCSRATSTPRV